MKLAQSRVTAQGQVSVPAEVRRQLGLAAGSVLEWVEEEDGSVVVKRAHRFTSEQIHRALFPEGAGAAPKLSEFKAGIAEYMKSRHARR
jgi:antitoxin PrlF